MKFDPCKEYGKEYKLDDLILIGEQAKWEASFKIANAFGIGFDFVNIKCDTYDQSLEIYLFKGGINDIESLVTPENVQKITEITGSKHFWINLCDYDLAEGSNFVYQDIHCGYIGDPNMKNRWTKKKKYID